MQGALCGALTVFEDRVAGQGRTIDLATLRAHGNGEVPAARILIVTGS